MNVLRAAEIASLVRESLATALLGEAGEKLEEVKVLELLERPYSTTAFLTARTDQNRHRLVFKQIVDHPLNTRIVDEPNQAVVEYSVLSRLHPRFLAVEGCSVPRPVAVLAEANAFIMEHVEGRIMADDLAAVHFFCDRRRFRRLCNDFQACGKWLKHFQGFTGVRFADVDALDNILVRCEDRLEVIEKSGDRRCPEDFRTQTMRLLNRLVGQLAGAPIPVAGRHGDFGPWNTLVNDEGVTVFDFFGYRVDPLPVDIFVLLVYLDKIGHGIANSRSRIARLQRSFLEGYGPLPEVPSPLLQLCEAHQRILQIAASVLAEADAWTIQWENSVAIRANVGWLLGQQKRPALWPALP